MTKRGGDVDGRRGAKSRTTALPTVVLAGSHELLSAELQGELEAAGAAVERAPSWRALADLPRRLPCNVVVVVALDAGASALDVMERMDGVDGLRRAKLMFVVPEGTRTDRLRCLAAGAEYYSVCPPRADELVARLRGIASRRRRYVDAARSRADAPRSGSPRPRVLVVEDDAGIRQLMAAVLERHGFDVVVARTGDGFIERVVAERPTLIVLDVMLPNADGLSLCRALRDHDDVGSTPVLFVSALTSVKVRAEGLETGGNDYMTKPFSPSDLVSRCRRLISVQPAA